MHLPHRHQHTITFSFHICPSYDSNSLSVQCLSGRPTDSSNYWFETVQSWKCPLLILQLAQITKWDDHCCGSKESAEVLSSGSDPYHNLDKHQQENHHSLRWLEAPLKEQGEFRIFVKPETKGFQRRAPRPLWLRPSGSPHSDDDCRGQRVPS